MAGKISTRERRSNARHGLNFVGRIWESVTLRAVLATSTIGLALWVLWGPRLRHAHLYPSFGDLGEWAAAVGSLAAVVVALAQTHQLHVERLDDLRREEEQRRTQFFAWVAYRDEGVGSGGWWVYFNNLTHAPIGVWVLHIEDAETGRRVTLDVTRLLPILPGFTQQPAGINPGDLLRPVCRL
jgi:hypothetical protein